MTFAIFILTVAALPPQKAASQPPSGAPHYDRSPHCRTASHSGSSSFKLPPPGKKWSVRAAVGIRQLYCIRKKPELQGVNCEFCLNRDKKTRLLNSRRAFDEIDYSAG
jgi:hypothetical protein